MTDVFIVFRRDGDHELFDAVYESFDLAAQHAAELGGDVVRSELRSAIRPDVIDPELVSQRAAERAAQEAAWSTYQTWLRTNLMG